MTDRYKAALETILRGDYPRPVAYPWHDNTSQIDDLCSHYKPIPGNCIECLDAYIESVLAGDGET